MYILKCIWVILCLTDICFADLKNCSRAHEQPAICFKNETGYSKPFPTVLDVGVYFKDIVEIDEQKNLISIQMDLWTFWSDPRLALSNGEIIGWANEYFPVRTAIESLLTQFEKLGILLSLTKRQKPKCGTLRLSLKMH